MPEFIPGLRLNQLFFEEEVRPILEVDFPGLVYSAARLGWGSEVFGFDDEQSTDHHWGLAFLIFVSEDDRTKYEKGIVEALRRKLPHQFRGYPTGFGPPDEIGVRLMRETDSGPVEHGIDVETVENFFGWYLGCNPLGELTAADWLTFSENKLLGATSGRVFHDDLGTLTAARERLSYYPKNVWLYQLAAQWTKIFEEQAFVGRCGQVGDDVGSALVAARQVKNLMKLCFLMERKYAPYNKWLGTAFSRLESASELTPYFQETLTAETWEAREEALSGAYEIIARLHNQLGLTSPINEQVSAYHGRPFRVLEAEHLVGDILKNISSGEVMRIKHGLGSVNQLVDSTDQISHPALARAFKVLYE